MFLGLCVAFLAAVSGCREQSHAQQQSAPPPPAVVVAPVERVDINPRIEYVGQTVAVDTVDLRARVQAMLVRRTFVEGDDVDAGDTAVRPRTRALRGCGRAPRQRKWRSSAPPSFAPAATWNAPAPSLARATSASNRSTGRSPTSSRRKRCCEGSEAELRQAQINLGYTQIVAPFDGRIGRSVYSVGQWVGPDSGVLATLVKLDPIYVVFNVSEQRYLDYQLRVEQAIRAGTAKPEYVPRLRSVQWRRLSGMPARLTFVDNEVDPSTGTIAVRAEFPNPEKLLVPGLFVTIVLEQAETKPALLVPQAAVQEDQAGKFVLVVGDGDKVEVRRVETGARVGVRWEVSSGLVEGERVIWEGIQKVRPGAQVAPTVKLPAAPTG